MIVGDVVHFLPNKLFVSLGLYVYWRAEWPKALFSLSLTETVVLLDNFIISFKTSTISKSFVSSVNRN